MDMDSKELISEIEKQLKDAEWEIEYHTGKAEGGKVKKYIAETMLKNIKNGVK